MVADEGSAAANVGINVHARADVSVRVHERPADQVGSILDEAVVHIALIKGAAKIIPGNEADPLGPGLGAGDELGRREGGRVNVPEGSARAADVELGVVADTFLVGGDDEDAFDSLGNGKAAAGAAGGREGDSHVAGRVGRGGLALGRKAEDRKTGDERDVHL